MKDSGITINLNTQPKKRHASVYYTPFKLVMTMNGCCFLHLLLIYRYCENNLKGMKYSDENTVLMSESGVKYVEKLKSPKF